MENNLIDILARLGFKNDRIGYEYIYKAIMFILENPASFGRPVTRLYEEISRQYPVSARGVESEIRRTIKASWNRGSVTLANEIFQNSIPYTRNCPSNAEFIMTIADYILVEFGSCFD